MKKIKRKKLKIIFAGYSGENNTGAESRIVTTIEDIKETIGKELPVYITVPTLSSANTRRYVKDESVYVMQMGMILKFLLNILKIIFQWNDMLIIVEGASFTDHFSSMFIYIFLFSVAVAKLCGKKVVAYALDCGNLKPFTQKVFKLIGNKIDLLIARTEDSKERMIKYGIKKEIFVTTDPAIQYKPPSEEYIQNTLTRLNLTIFDTHLAICSGQEEQKYQGEVTIKNQELQQTNQQPKQESQSTYCPPLIGIAPKEFFWFPIKLQLWGPKENFFHYPLYHTWTKEGHTKSKNMKRVFSDFTDFCIENFSSYVLLIAMEKMDYPPVKDIYNMVKHKEFVRIVSSNEYNLEDISGLLSKLKFLVTTRYHASVLSICSFIPQIAVSSDIRLEGIFKDLDMMDFYVDYLSKDLYKILIEKSLKIVSHKNEIKKKLSEKYPILLEKCLQNRIILKNWFLETFEPNKKHL